MLEENAKRILLQSNISKEDLAYLAEELVREAQLVLTEVPALQKHLERQNMILTVLFLGLLAVQVPEIINLMNEGAARSYPHPSANLLNPETALVFIHLALAAAPPLVIKFFLERKNKPYMESVSNLETKQSLIIWLEKVINLPGLTPTALGQLNHVLIQLKSQNLTEK